MDPSPVAGFAPDEEPAALRSEPFDDIVDTPVIAGKPRAKTNPRAPETSDK